MAAMFTRRTDWESTPNRLTAAWSRRRSSGLPCVDLTVSNPTRCGFRYPGREILAALADPRGLLYEPSPKGLRPAREAVAKTGTGLDPEHLILTASTSEAYAWLFKLLCERGDHVLTPRPSYPLLDFLAGLEDVELDPYPLRYESRWRVDLEALEGAIHPRTRAVVVVHPNNPTGSFVRKDEAAALGRLCAARGLALISDEVFLAYPWRQAARSHTTETGPSPGRSPGSDPPAGSLAADSPCLAFSLGGLSKTAGLPQIKVGWIRAGGPEALAQEALARLEVIADTYLSVNSPAQWALPALLRLGAPLREEILGRVCANRAWLDARACRHSGRPWTLLAAEGGWYAVLRIPATRSEEEWCLMLLEDEGVLLHPGYFFDFETEAYLVASLLPREEEFREALERILTRIEARA